MKKSWFKYPLTACTIIVFSMSASSMALADAPVIDTDIFSSTLNKKIEYKNCTCYKTDSKGNARKTFTEDGWSLLDCRNEHKKVKANGKGQYCFWDGKSIPRER
jgi:hypothetical protein